MSGTTGPVATWVGRRRLAAKRRQLTGEPVKRLLFLFWRHGFSAERNSAVCKGKSLRCLRKCRFSYIDTSPALSAQRHLRAALRYSACPPHRPSCLHLGCQTHQTWCAPRHLEPPPASIGRLFNEPNSKLFAGNYGCNRRSHLAHGTPQGSAWNRLEPNARLCVAVAQVVKVQAGCVAIWQRLRAIGRPACHHR